MFKLSDLKIMTSTSSIISKQIQLQFQEEMLLLASSRKKLTIGIPKENFESEKRIAFSPNTVSFLSENGINIYIEKGAGEAALFSDMEYSEAGAQIIEEQEAVFKVDVVVKIAPPTDKQITYLKRNQILISSLNIRTLEKSFFEKLSEKKITAIALEYIKDEFSNFPFVQFMSEIAGKVAINIASNFLMEKKGKLLLGIGGHKPSEIVIIGAGHVSQSVVNSAIEAGALVKVFDNSVSSLKELEENIKYKVYTSVLYPSVLKKEFSRADIVIGVLSKLDKENKDIISEDLIKLMKKDSLIIDLSIDQGSCFENSKLTNYKNPTFEKKGVTYFAVPNIPSMVPRTASYVLGNLFLQQFSNLQTYANVNQFLKNDLNFRNGLYLYNGILVNQRISEIFDLPYQDINLILAAF